MTDVPSHNANGAALIEYYASREPDPEFAGILEQVHRSMNQPIPPLLLRGVDDESATESE